MMAAQATRLLKPSAELLAGHVQALEKGWSADTVRGAAAAQEALAHIERDPAGYVAMLDNPQGGGEPVTLADGSRVERLPGFTRWIWDGDDGPDGFAGSINLRWAKGHGPLPTHVLGHCGYAVVPWKRGHGHATRALGLLLELARGVGMPVMVLTTDLDNAVSQRVITANGGVATGEFDKGPVYGHKRGLRFEIAL